VRGKCAAELWVVRGVHDCVDGGLGQFPVAARESVDPDGGDLGGEDGFAESCGVVGADLAGALNADRGGHSATSSLKLVIMVTIPQRLASGS
jgi:hypothetical protein